MSLLRKKNSLDICIENPNLVFRRKDVRFPNILQSKKGHLALLILALRSASVPPCVSTTLPRYVKWLDKGSKGQTGAITLSHDKTSNTIAKHYQFSYKELTLQVTYLGNTALWM